MDLALPRFAGLADGPRQVHPPWSIPSDLPESPAPARLETGGEEDSHCSVDQMSVSSTYLNLDALSSSSGDDSQDWAERSDLSVTLFCESDEAGTHVTSDQISSDGDFPAESGTKDIRQVLRRCVSSPGGQIIGAANRTIGSMSPLLRWLTSRQESASREKFPEHLPQHRLRWI